jgi:hypothetical protein
MTRLWIQSVPQNRVGEKPMQCRSCIEVVHGEQACRYKESGGVQGCSERRTGLRWCGSECEERAVVSMF